jgi:hypothetical protein
MKVLPNLQEQYQRHGGKIVMFQRVTSMIVISWETTHLEFVPPHFSRSWVGFKYVLWNLFLGWWSISGLWCTPSAILNSLLGGIDVTELVTDLPVSFNARQPSIIKKALDVLENRERYMMLLVIILLIVAFMTYIALSPTAAIRILQNQQQK